MDLYYEVAGSRSAGTRTLPDGEFLTASLDEKGAGDRSTMLVVMADGIDDLGGGRIASNLVVSAFNRSVVRRFGETGLPELLRAGVIDANQVLLKSVRGNPGLQGMACTLLGVALVRNRVHWASVGDSHLYLIRDGALRKLNHDHRYGGYLERLRAQGIEVEPEPDIAPDMLMSAMTGEEIDEVDCPDEGFDLRDGDRLILASQSMESAGDATILEVSGRSASAEEGVAALMRVIRPVGNDRPDGATVIVVDVFDRDPPPAAASRAADAPAEAAPRPPPRARSRASALDVAHGVMSAVVFAVAAVGTWYGLGVLAEFRQPPQPAPSLPASVAPVPVPAPTAATAQGQGGLTFGAAPPPAVPGAPSGSGAGESLSFGAPAPPRGIGAAAAPSTPTPAPVAVEGGFRDPLAAGGEGPLMVEIPGGRFEMGGGALSSRAEERPRRSVTVEAFALGRYEVTVAEYERFARDTGRKMPAVDVHDPQTTPVSRVTWDDAYAYANWLSRQTGARYRLASEAEWEYAAGAGSAAAYWWGNEPGENRAHCSDCGTALDPRRPTQVGRFPANPFGLHDTAGNVAEWVHDCWHPSYRDAPSSGGVWEGGDCSMRVVRGGGFDSPSQSIRTRARARAPSTQAVDSVGFRVARDLRR